jgi:hypothetical protein
MGAFFFCGLETLYGSVDRISLGCKRDVKKKKKSRHVVEFLLNHVSYSMPSIDMDEC